MGNCNSSQICGLREFDGPMEFNADIAGIGILISFFFSALAVFVVVILGYLTATLPSGLLQPTDQHALLLLKTPFTRKRSHHRAEVVVSTQTPKQRSHSQVLVRFLKMLSDQQLITGLSILIAALSSRCVIRRYEWHIVTSLAYFSATTHTLSLDVLRDHLAQHAWIRYCRVLFTLIFVILFSFVYVVDHVKMSEPEPGFGLRIMQCEFLEWKSHYHDGFTGRDYGTAEIGSTVEIAVTVVPVLTILWAKHVSALTRVIAPEATHYRHVTTTLMNRVSTHFWSWTNSLSTSESTKLVADAHLYYDTKIRPFSKRTKMSIWYFLEQYHESYLSEMPVWAFQLVFGTANAIRAVRDRNVDLLNGSSTLGFGQVVAIGLLVLPLLALVEIISEQTVFDKSPSLPAHEHLNQLDATNSSSPGLVISESLTESSSNPPNDDVNQSGRAANQLLHRTTRKVAIISLILCAFATALMIVVGIIHNDDFVQLYMLMGIVPLWALSKLVIALNRQLHQAQYIWKEIKSRKTKKTSTQPLLPAPGTSDESTPAIMSGSSVLDVPPRLPSLDISDDQRDHAHTTATETSPIFGRPRRQDTEASLGLTAMFNRQGGSS